MLEFLFGKPRKSARRKIKRRYNVPGSPCNRLRKNKCRSKRGCAHTKRGCRRAKGFASMIAQGIVPAVNEQIIESAVDAAKAAAKVDAPIEDVAKIAAAAAADTASANVLAVGGTSTEAKIAAVGAAEAAAQQVVADLPPAQASAVVSDAVKIISSAPKGMGSMAALAAAGRSNLRKTAPRELPIQSSINPIAAAAAAAANARKMKAEEMSELMFGRRRLRFGSVCTDIRPKDAESCMSYNEGGMYPCTWAKPNTCRVRTGGPVPFSYASMHGQYKQYVVSSTPSLYTALIPRTPTPVSPSMVPPKASGPMKCARLSESACTFNNLSCDWHPVSRTCARKKGILGGSIYEGPMLQSPVSTPEYLKEAAELMFGKKRRAPRRKKSVTPEYMKEAAELMFGHRSSKFGYCTKPLEFGKKRRVSRRKTSRKPPSAIRKMCKKLKIKITKKVGGRRVYKSLAVLKKQIKLKKKKMMKR